MYYRTKSFKFPSYYGITGASDLDGTWLISSPDPNVNGKTIHIEDGYLIDYGGIPPRAIEYLGGNKIQFNFGFTPFPTAEAIGGNLIAWSTGEQWKKTASAPAPTPAPASNPTPQPTASTQSMQQSTDSTINTGATDDTTSDDSGKILGIPKVGFWIGVGVVVVLGGFLTYRMIKRKNLKKS